MKEESKKDKVIEWSLSTLILGIYFVAILCNDIDSYRIVYLAGSEWVLFWSMVLYLPLFPLVSGILMILVSNFSVLSVSIINLVFTIVFAFHAYSRGFLATSWALLVIVNLLFLAAVCYDTYKKNH